MELVQEFPYKPRLGQLDIVRDGFKHLESANKFWIFRYIGGKEVCAAMMASHWVQNGGKVFWLTSRKFGVENKLKELDKINTKGFKVLYLTSKTEICDLKRELEKENGKEIANVYNFCRWQKASCHFYQALKQSNLKTGSTVHWKNLPSGICRYYALRELVKSANIVVFDYNYLINPMIRQAIDKDLHDLRTSKSLVLIDEVHTLPERARRVIDGNLSMKRLQLALVETTRYEHYIVGTENAAKLLKQLQKRVLGINARYKPQVEAELRSGCRKELAQITPNDFKPDLHGAKMLLDVGERVEEFMIKHEQGTVSHIKEVGNFLKSYEHFREDRWIYLGCGKG